LDPLTLPSHTSHEIQPLDVSYFKPFKLAFSLLRDVWTLKNKSKGATKEVLASWVSKALQKGLLESNIRSGLYTTSIFMFNPHVMDGKMDANKYYKQVPVDKVVDLVATDESPLETILSAQLMPVSPELGNDPKLDADYIYKEG